MTSALTPIVFDSATEIEYAKVVVPLFPDTKKGTLTPFTQTVQAPDAPADILTT